MLTRSSLLSISGVARKFLIKSSRASIAAVTSFSRRSAACFSKF
jgi:hypothetical protein